ncbi:MAG: NAD-dependent epimerase/dehydratase family protein [Xanthomonadales bacterium]|nr:NAD-dependent epimerase/dehydratase family protein [Xanthomonadales bacterium]
MTILITGGCGFIGSHACVVLQEAGYEVLVLDSLCNSNREVIGRWQQSRKSE